MVQMLRVESTSLLKQLQKLQKLELQDGFLHDPLMNEKIPKI